MPSLWKEPSLDAIRKGLTAASGQGAPPPPRPVSGNWGCTGFGPYSSVMELAGAIEAWVVAGGLGPSDFAVQYGQSPAAGPDAKGQDLLFTAIVTWQRTP